jgi:hypothetical protein
MGIHIEPTDVFDNERLLELLGVSEAALIRARRDGRLKHTRQGNKILYLGKWVIDWLNNDCQEVAHAS